MSKLKTCPFCDAEEIYETKRENELGTIIPQLFCNCCKMTFEIENDSPYLNDDKTYDYLKEKLHNLWNTRKPMDRIVERLEEERLTSHSARSEFITGMNLVSANVCVGEINTYTKAIKIVKEEGGIEWL